MAKVMVSLPDELVASIDAEAKRLGTTRSGLLRVYADEALRRRAGERAERIAEILAAAPAIESGGRGIDELKRLRPSP